MKLDNSIQSSSKSISTLQEAVTLTNSTISQQLAETRTSLESKMQSLSKHTIEIQDMQIGVNRRIAEQDQRIRDMR